jgi:hypothetical protein
VRLLWLYISVVKALNQSSSRSCLQNEIKVSFPAYVIFVVLFASQKGGRNYEIANQLETFTGSIFFDLFLTLAESLAPFLCCYSDSS